MKLKYSLKPFLTILSGTLCLMMAALYNKYPIVFSDTGTYLASGFDKVFPPDRPITYGIFINTMSLNGVSLWLPVFMQSLILSYLIFLTLKLVLQDKFRYRIAALCYVFLFFFTSASWVASMIMADVFTPIGIFSGVLILLGNYKKSTQVLLYAIFFLAVAAHFSHILIFGGLFAFVFVFKKWMLPGKLYPKHHFRALALVALTLLASVSIMKPSLDKAKSIIYVCTMCSQGITQQYLKENCSSKHYELCKYVDSLPSGNFAGTRLEFIIPNSPLAMSKWNDSLLNECSDIMYGTFTSPRFIWLHIQVSLRCTFKQLFSFATGGGNGPYMQEYPVLANVRTHFKNEYKDYCNSQQNKNTLLNIIGWWNDLLNITIALSIVLLITLFFARRSVYKGALGLIVIMFLIGVLLNAWDCGTFSDINLRYGSRIMWLIPFLAFMAVAQLYSKTRQKS